MKDFFERVNDKIREFMTGRYGTDDFSKFLLTATLILFLLSLITGWGFVYLLALAGLIYSYYRILSRDFAARSEENRKYLGLIESAKKKLRVQKKRFDGRKDYRFFKCPGCGQEVRVPKGKGHIRITCPKCSEQFDRTV